MNLSEIQMDILKEIGNIGAGRAAEALSKFLHQEVSMSLPYLEKLNDFDQIINKVVADFGIQEAEFAMIYTTILDSSDYLLFCLIPTESCQELISLSFEDDITQTEDGKALVESMIREVGNILLITYIDALNKFLSLNLMAESGQIVFGTMKQIMALYNDKLNTSENYSPSMESHLLVDLSIFAISQKISAYLGLIPTETTVTKISESLL